MKSGRQLYYFGCLGNKGHFLWDRERSANVEGVLKTMPGINPNVLRRIDGTFAPGNPYEPTGLYMESIVPPVRIVAWWDRSVDSRPGSNSALIGYGYDAAEEMLTDAEVLFPSVMGRQPRPTPV